MKLETWTVKFPRPLRYRNARLSLVGLGVGDVCEGAGVEGFPALGGVEVVLV